MYEEKAYLLNDSDSEVFKVKSRLLDTIYW